MNIDYPELADFLLVAEAVLQTPAKKIAEEANLHLADSALHAPAARFADEDFYPDFATKAAVLCAHLVKNHPLKDGNAQVALVLTIEFCGAQRRSPGPRLPTTTTERSPPRSSSTWRRRSSPTPPWTTWPAGSPTASRGPGPGFPPREPATRPRS